MGYEKHTHNTSWICLTQHNAQKVQVGYKQHRETQTLHRRVVGSNLTSGSGCPPPPTCKRWHQCLVPWTRPKLRKALISYKHVCITPTAARKNEIKKQSKNRHDKIIYIYIYIYISSVEFLSRLHNMALSLSSTVRIPK